MFLLASASPQRRELLEAAGVPFAVVPTSCDEGTIEAGAPESTALERARAKALGADWEAHREALAAGEAAVLGVDTVAILGREIIGKPADRVEAAALLARLAGTTHTVATAHVCWRPALGDMEEKTAFGMALARITMRQVSQAEIDAYVASGEADGKAGAYALQDGADRFVDDLQGERDTVIGLHVATARKLYREVTGREAG